MADSPTTPRNGASRRLRGMANRGRDLATRANVDVRIATAEHGCHATLLVTSAQVGFTAKTFAANPIEQAAMENPIQLISH